MAGLEFGKTGSFDFDLVSNGNGRLQSKGRGDVFISLIEGTDLGGFAP